MPASGQARSADHPLLEGYERVEVEWVDSHRDDGWQEASEYGERSKGPDEFSCISAGYLIRESDLSITLALGLGMQTDTSMLVLSPLTIPRVAITKITRLNRGRRR